MAVAAIFLAILCHFVVLAALVGGAAGAGGLGVNYGRQRSSLPSPALVARFLAGSTVFDRVRLFDCDPLTVSAFAGTGIAIDVTIPSEVIPSLTNLTFAQHWVTDNILPHDSATTIARILVGNEVVASGDGALISSLVPAMQNLHTALAGAGLQQKVKVSSPQSMAIFAASSPPSAARFRQGYDENVFRPLLSFLMSTGSPFMINAYPFFGISPETLDFALFRQSSGVVDPATGLIYNSMLEAQLDAVFSAMKALGYGDVEIAVAESGWPAAGEPWELGAGVENARQYNTNFLRSVSSGAGTPLMPNRTFEAFLFSLFNEDLKPGAASERNYGIFSPNFSPIYDIGVLRRPGVTPPEATASTASTASATSAAASWCLPKPNTDEKLLQKNIDFVCGGGVEDCMAIQPTGSCFFPDTLQAHAAFAMNAFYQAAARSPSACDFGQTGVITLEDPSYGSCQYRS